MSLHSIRRSHIILWAFTISCIVSVAVPVVYGASTPSATINKVPLLSLSLQQINQIMNFLKTTEPDVYVKAQFLRRSDPEKFNNLIAQAAPTFARLERMSKNDPKLLNLTLQDLADTHESFKLADELRQPGLPQSAAQLLRVRLQRIVTAQFNLRQEIRLHELNALVKKINELKTQLQQRDTRRNAIINNRVAELIGNPPSVNW